MQKMWESNTRDVREVTSITYLESVICVVVFDREYVVIDREEVAVGSHDVSKVKGLCCKRKNKLKITNN